MKSRLGVMVVAIALLAFSARIGLYAQDQLHPSQTEQDVPNATLATANYNLLIASGFLCEPDDSAPCPAVARASNGETVEITGAGTLGLSGKTVSAAGAFTEKTAAGDLVSTGVWTATELTSFLSYGIAPRALLIEHPRMRALVMGRGGQMAGPLATGGRAVLRVRLLPDAGNPEEAVLQINCAKGEVPSDEAADGIKLIISGGGPVFDQVVSGRTSYLLRPPVSRFASKQAIERQRSEVPQ